MRLSRGKPSLFARPWQENRRVVLLTLIGLNVASFVAQFFLDTFEPGFVRDYFALSNRGVHDAYAWQFVTAMLLYGGPWHLLGNVLVLYVLGRDIESILGQRHFLYLFLSGAIGGELGHLFLMPSETLLYAASGGVAAVLISYATILPELDLVAWRLSRFSFHLKAKCVAYAILFLSLVMLVIDRNGAVMHSAIPGGLAAGWLYTNLLGFGHPSWLQRILRRRREAAMRVQRMTPAEFIEHEIDPLLEKISRNGMQSLTRAERRLLSQAREKVG
ncbi:MAG: rhomboid family intramembrane serine protease [Verrucomicrobiota bacterium]|nr:rhomboid family intramembrane serine protease [Verrucomicrobiota bacterium]